MTPGDPELLQPTNAQKDATQPDEVDDGDDGLIAEDAPATGILIFSYCPVAVLYPHFLSPGEVKKKKKKRKPKKKKLEQSDPPRLGLSKFFPDGIYPEGEIQPYKDEYVPLENSTRPPIIYV